jgi:hypothetical protein
MITGVIVLHPFVPQILTTVLDRGHTDKRTPINIVNIRSPKNVPARISSPSECKVSRQQLKTPNDGDDEQASCHSENEQLENR